MQLVRDLGDELESFAKKVSCDPNLEEDNLVESLHEDAQPRLSALLADRVRNDSSFAQYLPEAFKTAIEDLRGVT